MDESKRRNTLIAFAVLFAFFIAGIALLAHPHQLADWAFVVGLAFVIVFAAFGSSGALSGWFYGSEGGLAFRPKRLKRLAQDRPD